MTKPNNNCPNCGTVLPADAPAGLCPRCLMAAGMTGESAAGGEFDSNVPTTPPPHARGFVPPIPCDLAAHFPQLEILELIGAGGMGAVYKARQPALDRIVALKILPPEINADPSFAQRFTREAQALGRLNHQHIVSVYDFGVTDGLYYFIMEFVDGSNLRQLIARGELQPPQALAIVPQICEALQFAHDEGVVHRDIKPENILIDKRGRVRIADFGLARILGKSSQEASLTGTHQVLGTLRYMAPEQLEGSREVDHRADIYSLGVVFYEMLTGQVPAGQFDPPSKKVQLDVRLDEVVLRALAREPERRYQQASAVKTDVESISASKRQAVLSPTTSAAPDDVELDSWTGFWGGVVHVFVVVVVFLFGFGLFVGGEDALRPLGVRTEGLWLRWVHLAGLLLMIAAGMSLGYEWKWPRRRLSANGIRTDMESIALTGERPTGRKLPAGDSSAQRGELALPAEKPRSTLGRAWDEWWAERDWWLATSLQLVLALVYFACLFQFVNFSTRTELHPQPNGEPIRETTVQLGVPNAPWLYFIDNPGGNEGFRDGVAFSWSFGVMLLGLLAYYAICRIGIAEINTRGGELRWYHSMGFNMTVGVAIWAIVSFCASILAYQAVDVARSHGTRANPPPAAESDSTAKRDRPGD